MTQKYNEDVESPNPKKIKCVYYQDTNGLDYINRETKNVYLIYSYMINSIEEMSLYIYNNKDDMNEETQNSFNEIIESFKKNFYSLKDIREDLHKDYLNYMMSDETINQHIEVYENMIERAISIMNFVEEYEEDGSITKVIKFQSQEDREQEWKDFWKRDSEEDY